MSGLSVDAICRLIRSPLSTTKADADKRGEEVRKLS